MNLVDTLREVIRDFYTKYITNVPLTNTLTIATMVLFWLVLGFIVIKITKLIVLRSSKLQDKGTKDRKPSRAGQRKRNIASSQKSAGLKHLLYRKESAKLIYVDGNGFEVAFTSFSIM
jgi:hypothetical protein